MQRLSGNQDAFSAIIKRILDEENVLSTEVKPKDNSVLRFHRTSENGVVRISCRLASESSDLGSEAAGSPSILSECSAESDGFSDSCSTSRVFQSNPIISTVCSKCPKHCVGEKRIPAPVLSTSSSSQSTSPSAAIPNSGTTSSERREEIEENNKRDWKIRKLGHTEEPISLTQNISDAQGVNPDKANSAPDKQSIAIGEIGPAECEGIIKILVEAAQDIFLKYPSGEKLEEIHKQQNQYLQMKKTKQVDEPNARTKADVLYASIAYLESKIIEIVKFAKCIPGFKDLSMDDQASLVRDSRTESVIIGGMRLINCKNKVFTTSYGQHFTIEEMASVYSKDFMEQKVMMSKRIVALDMSFEEETLLRAISITFTDRGPLEDLVEVQNMQNKLLTCLIYIIKKTGKHGCGVRLGQLFNVLINLRDITEVDMNEVKKILLETPAYTNSPVVNDFL